MARPSIATSPTGIVGSRPKRLGLVERSSATILPTVRRFSVPTVSPLISARTRVEVTSVSSFTLPCVRAIAFSRSSNLPSANVVAESKLR